MIVHQRPFVCKFSVLRFWNSTGTETVFNVKSNNVEYSDLLIEAMKPQTLRPQTVSTLSLSDLVLDSVTCVSLSEKE